MLRRLGASPFGLGCISGGRRQAPHRSRSPAPRLRWLPWGHSWFHLQLRRARRHWRYWWADDRLTTPARRRPAKNMRRC